MEMHDHHDKTATLDELLRAVKLGLAGIQDQISALRNEIAQRTEKPPSRRR